MDKVRIGLIGCGGMGRGLASQAATLDTAVVTAVADTQETPRTEAAAQFGARAYADYHDLLAADVDAVLVATPGGLHREPVEAAAAAKKHVFSEKPLAAFASDCDAMIAAVEAAGVKSMVGQVCRWHPTHRQLKQMVDGWPLGPVMSLYVERLGGGWGTAHPSWRLSRKLSGGSLLEINAHELDFMLWLAGPAKSVTAVGGQMMDQRLDYPDLTHVAINFVSGAVGVLQSSAITTLGSYAGRFDCRDGCATVASLFGGEITWCSREPGAQTQVCKPNQVETPVLGEIRAFVDSILHDTEPPVTFRQARHTVAVAEAAYLSIETGMLVEVK